MNIAQHGIGIHQIYKEYWTKSKINQWEMGCCGISINHYSFHRIKKVKKIDKYGTHHKGLFHLRS